MPIINRVNEDNFSVDSSIINKYYPLVRKITAKLFAKYSLGYEDNEDLSQNVMIKFSSIWENYQKYLREIPFEQFLTGSIHNIIINAVRRQARRQKILNELGKNELMNEMYLVEDFVEEERMEIRQALRKFQLKYPEMGKLLIDYYFYDYNDEEIAKKESFARIKLWRLRRQAIRVFRQYIESG